MIELRHETVLASPGIHKFAKLWPPILVSMLCGFLVLLPLILSTNLEAKEEHLYDAPPSPSRHYHLSTLSIPQQVLFSQFSGVGRVQAYSLDKAEVSVLQTWHGIPTNSCLLYPDALFDTIYATNQLVLFFATTNVWWSWRDARTMNDLLYSWNVVTNSVTSDWCRSSTNWHAVNDEWAFIPVKSIGSPLATFTSNLVDAVWVKKDEVLFKEVVATTTNYPWAHDIARHGRYYVFFNMQKFATNIVNDVLRKRP